MKDAKNRRLQIGPGGMTVVLLWFVGVLNYADRQILVSMAAPIMAEFRIDSKQFALLSSAYLWVYAAASPLAGWTADRLGYGRAVVFGLAAWSMLTFGTGWVRSYEMMLLLRILLAVAESFAIPAGAALIMECCRPSRRAFGLAIYFTGSAAGGFVGSSGGWIAQYWAWPVAFYVFGALGVFYALVLVFKLPRPVRQAARKDKASTYRKRSSAAVFSKNLLLLMAASGILGAGSWIMVAWLPHYFHVERGCSLAVAAFCGMGIVSLATVTGMLLIGLLSDRLEAVANVRRALVPATALLAAGPLLLGIAWIDSLPWIVAIVFAVGFANGAVAPNLMPILCRTVPSKHKATACGLLNFSATLLGGAAVYLVGILKDGGIALGVSFQIASALLFSSGILFLYLGLCGEGRLAGAMPRRF